MKYELYTRVTLQTEMPQHKLRRGDLATVVEFHPGRPGQEPGYTLEVFNAIGQTVAVITVRESQIDALRADEILHARAISAAA